MGNETLVKPKAIQAFEKRFKTEADYCEDVFYLRIASSWQELFRTAFCFVNDSSLEEEKLLLGHYKMISSEGVAFTGELLKIDVWGSGCLLAKGELRTSHKLGRLVFDLWDGVYLVVPVGSIFLNNV